jgi:hypothetical protein
MTQRTHATWTLLTSGDGSGPRLGHHTLATAVSRIGVKRSDKDRGAVCWLGSHDDQEDMETTSEGQLTERTRSISFGSR